MTARRRICVVTGSRADYGLLRPVMEAVRAHPALALQVAATGMHLSPEFGRTVSEIEADGYPVDARVETLLSSDTAVGIAKSVGLGVIGFADALDRLRPDVVLVLGDRFEVLAAVQAALVARVPVAHVAGGDVTEGAYDESIRHAITKMAHLHLVTHAEAARRVRQLGEDPERIHVVGSPGLDAVRLLDLPDRDALSRALDFPFRARNLLVTFHPVTLEPGEAARQFDELLSALDRLGPDVGLLFTRPNADNEGRGLIARLDAFAAARPNARAYASLGHRRYLGAVAQVDAVVGNSSSGLYEVPSFRKATVNVGDRQKGRPRASSVIDCAPLAAEIEAAIRRALALDCSGAVNPYGDGHAAERIAALLAGLPDPPTLLRKPFFDLEVTA